MRTCGIRYDIFTEAACGSRIVGLAAGWGYAVEKAPRLGLRMQLLGFVADRPPTVLKTERFKNGELQ